METDDSGSYTSLFVGDIPLLDVRAPVEFAKGAFPMAVNQPLMDDQERHKVGLCYARRGQEAALALGNRLVSGELRSQRMSGWAAFFRENPQGHLYCFRGGLRSQIVQTWLAVEGLRVPRVPGGFRAMRSFLMECTEKTIAECEFLVLGGLTGTGKTEVLADIPGAVDLEHHANHRGSGFGRRVMSQPSQVDFEHRLAIDFLRQRHRGITRFLLEDEGAMIGSRSLPLSLRNLMKKAPLLWLEDSLENRVQRVLSQYVREQSNEFITFFGEEAGFLAYSARLKDSLWHIRSRVGDERYRSLISTMNQALDQQQKTGSIELHRIWIEALLVDYYDPMYVHQMAEKRDRIRFFGQKRAILEYLSEYFEMASYGI